MRSNSDYDLFLLDISSCGNKTARDLDFLIKNHFDDKDFKYSSRILLSEYYRQLISSKIDEKQIARHLYEISFAINQPNLDKEICYRFDNDFYIAEIGIAGHLSDIKNLIRTFLSIFSVYTLENYLLWTKIHQSVDKAVLDFNNLYTNKPAPNT